MVNICVYQINLQTQIINSIKNDTIKTQLENIYSFKVQDIQKNFGRIPTSSIYWYQFNSDNYFNQFYEGQKLLEVMLLGKQQKTSERTSSNDNLENILQFKMNV